MKLEIIKETKINGDIFYHLQKDGKYVSDSTVYATIRPCEALQKIENLFEKIKNNEISTTEIIKSEEIPVTL